LRSLARALKPSPDRLNSFSEIRITDGTVIVRDDSYRIVETLSNVEFALAWPSISRTFAATGHFNWKDQPVQGAVSLTDFAGALAGERSGLKVRLSGAGPTCFGVYGSRAVALAAAGRLRTRHPGWWIEAAVLS